MRQFNRVIYGLINVHLKSALHIGGSDEEHFSMAINGNGEYIIPGTSLAGVVKHYLCPDSTVRSEKAALLGDIDGESSIYFYDAILHHADVEERMGVRIDYKTGVAEDGGLYTNYYLAAGAKAQIRIQMFAKDENEAELERTMFHEIVAAIAQGKIRFGAKTRSGAGLLSVDYAYERDLDLTKEEDLDVYLEGPEASFALLDEKKNGNQISLKDMADEGGNLWVLRADIPEGLIVRSGEKPDIADAVNMSHGGDETNFYIPGTSLKGIMRSYTEKVVHTLGMQEKVLTDIFGAEPTDHNTKAASHILTQDIEIDHPKRTLYPRIRVDRVFGGTITGAKMCAEILSKPQKPLEIRVVVDQGLDERNKKIANAFAFLALRDLGLGLVRIGGGSSVGFGRLQGIDLSWNGNKAVFEKKRLNFGNAENDIKERDIKELLAALEGGLK